MPSRADVYRMNAEQCRIRAEMARSKETRAEFLEVVEQCRQLAEAVEAVDEPRRGSGD